MEPRNIASDIARVAQNYNYHEPPLFLIKLQEFIANAVRVLRDLLNMLRLPSPGESDTRIVGNLLQLMLMAAGTAVVIIVILMVARRLSHIEMQRKLAKGGIIVGESKLDAAGWKELAAKLALSKNFREACRALYMSALHNLDENKIAVFAPTKTNYEYIYSLKKWPTLAGQFRSLVDLVELIWFGGKTAVQDDYQLCLEILVGLEGASRSALAQNQEKNGAVTLK